MPAPTSNLVWEHTRFAVVGLLASANYARMHGSLVVSVLGGSAWVMLVVLTALTQRTSGALTCHGSDTDSTYEGHA